MLQLGVEHLRHLPVETMLGAIGSLAKAERLLPSMLHSCVID
jgi:hypothetical protein